MFVNNYRKPKSGGWLPGAMRTKEAYTKILYYYVIIYTSHKNVQ